MKQEFIEGEYTIEIRAEIAPTAGDADRVTVEVVISRSQDKEVVSAFTRFVAGREAPVSLEDAIKVGHRAAIEIIGARLPDQ
jgi:hypothetical protein